MTAKEIVDQVMFIVNLDETRPLPSNTKEFKINYTRMGEPFLNIDAVKEAIYIIDTIIPNAHHYISTVGLLHLLYKKANMYR